MSPRLYVEGNQAMVKIHVKRGDDSQFLYEATLETPMSDILKDCATIYNGRLKVDRICGEMEELVKHGVSLPPNMQGLTDEQIEELKLKDEWGEKCQPSGGVKFNKDTIGCRNGQAPTPKMAEVLTKTIKEAKDMISKLVQASLEVIDIDQASLWWAGKELLPNKKLGDYVGKNEKTKIVAKIQKKGHGAPSREPVVSPEEQKNMMAYYYKKQEEMKRLEKEEDDAYMNAEWADQHQLKRQFQGLNNIKWGPR
uniref:Ubiquitin-like domain-containing protein n=1 Tax=Biomphalaria glabrata TaxID=6526 RepID=A0A2C9JCB8_BIOGL